MDSDAAFAEATRVLTGALWDEICYGEDDEGVETVLGSPHSDPLQADEAPTPGQRGEACHAQRSQELLQEGARHMKMARDLLRSEGHEPAASAPPSSKPPLETPEVQAALGVRTTRASGSLAATPTDVFHAWFMAILETPEV